MKYRVTIRGQKADYNATIECDEIEFRGSWWAVFVRRETAQGYEGQAVIVAAVPADNVNLIEKVEEKA